MATPFERMLRDTPRPAAPVPGMNARDQRVGRGISVKPNHIGRKAAAKHVRPFRPGKDDWRVTQSGGAAEHFNPEAQTVAGKTAAEDQLLALIRAWNGGMQSDEIRESIEYGLGRIEHRDSFRAIEFRSIWRG